MYQIFLVVLAIGLMALVVGGGANYLNSDFAVRYETADRVAGAYRAYGSALSAYRLANRGAVPSDANGALSPFLPFAPQGYVDTTFQVATIGGTVYFCVAVSPSASEGRLQGVRLAAQRAATVLEGAACGIGGGVAAPNRPVYSFVVGGVS